MKASKKSIDIASVKKRILALLRFVNRYKAIMFFLLIAGLYGFILWRINNLSNIPASEADVAELQNAAKQPHIKPETITRLRSLQDNSVRVQTLFSETRNNPFNE